LIQKEFSPPLEHYFRVVNALDFSHPYLRSMRDPRTPEILAWLETLPLSQRLATLHAMSFAFPLLKNDRQWIRRIEIVLDELQPTAAQHADILFEAGSISLRLKRQLPTDEPAPVTPE
jgi:hypothetical protein